MHLQRVRKIKVHNDIATEDKMARPKGSKNKPKNSAINPSTSAASARVIVVTITEEMVMRNFSATELLGMATRMLGERKIESTTVADSVTGNRKKTRRRRAFSPEARAKMAEAQRRRWAGVKKKK